MKLKDLNIIFGSYQFLRGRIILAYSISLLLFILLSCTKHTEKLPWEREIPLKEAAKSAFFTSTLDTENPLPNRKCYPRNGKAMTINNLKMRTTLWGPPERLTISLTKNNVWDRMVNSRGLVAPTLQEIVDGANSPANAGFIGKGNDGQRPWGYGYLLKDAAGKNIPSGIRIYSYGHASYTWRNENRCC
jgi:hypothetical protein